MTSPDLSGVAWRKSSFSGNNGTCVEVADLVGAVAVRDSKDPGGLVLRFPAEVWSEFVVAVKSGQLPGLQ